MLKRTEKCLLGDVPGLFAIASKMICDAIDFSLITFHEDFESLAFPFLSTLHEFFIPKVGRPAHVHRI
jgi:hypothetical protein